MALVCFVLHHENSLTVPVNIKNEALTLQWFIDIILGMVAALGYLTTAYVSRGDPAAADFTIATLALDNNWHDWDMSSIVPAGAKLVLLHTIVKSGAIDKRIQFRTKGSTNWPSLSVSRVQVANINFERDCLVAPDADRVIQYKVSVVPWTTCHVTIAGWCF